jgi:predicted nucleotidyltransferase
LGEVQIVLSRQYSLCYCLKVINLNPAIDILRAKFGALQAVYLFGSQADDTARSDSDVDLAFLNNAPPVDSVELWNISQDIAVALNRDVHLIDIRHASEVFRAEIVSKAKVILDLDPEARKEFETYAICAYTDFNEQRRDFLEEFYRPIAGSRRPGES